MYNNGLQNEKEIINILNNKRIYKLPALWRSFVASIFFNDSLDNVVLCNKAASNKKEDIILIVNQHLETISIKSGHNVSVHTESLNRFCGFLKWLGISEESLDTLRLFHYGDGTKDGTGTLRIGSYELIKKYKREIEKFNEEINNSNKLIRIIYRFIRFGTPNQNSCADYIYLGDKDSGIHANTYWLGKYLANKDYSNISGIHFGPFIYDNASRDLNFKNTNENIENDNRRYYCNIKWPSIEEDIISFRESRMKNNLSKTMDKEEL